jgi:hypothetical protein
MPLADAMQGLRPAPEAVRCIVCDQVLKHPKSIERKMGPVCAARVALEEKEYQDANPEVDDG